MARKAETVGSGTDIIAGVVAGSGIVAHIGIVDELLGVLPIQFLVQSLVA